MRAARLVSAPMRTEPDDARLAERLAARTLEIVDVPSESRDEARLFEHLAGVLRAGGMEVEDAGDLCLVARPAGTRPEIALAGHLDTVPSQRNIPGRRD